ncbi:MAG: carboxypeptidase-like regulatory domain-containing protein [bacterium]
MRKYIIAGVIVALVLLFSIVYVTGRERTGLVYGHVADARNGGPVWEAHIVLDGKSTMRHEDTKYRLTGIPPGEHTLKIEAPGYKPFEQKVTVRRGANQIDVPMVGEKILDLKEVLIFGDLDDEGKNIDIEIRFVNSKGEGIVHFPGLDLKLDVKLHERIGDEKDYTKGKLLYEGPVELFWDHTAFLGKNKGIIPKDKLNPLEGGGERYGVLEGKLTIPNQGEFENVDSNVLLQRKK